MENAYNITFYQDVSDWSLYKSVNSGKSLLFPNGNIAQELAYAYQGQ